MTERDINTGSDRGDDSNQSFDIYAALYDNSNDRCFSRSDAALTKAETNITHLEFGSSNDLYFGRAAKEAPVCSQVSLESKKTAQNPDKSERSESQSNGQNESLQVSTAGFLAWVGKNFDKFDSNHDSMIDKNEAASQVLDRANTGANAVYAAQLNEHTQDIALAFHKAGDGSKNAELTRKKLAAFAAFVSDEKMMQAAHMNGEIYKIQENFIELDTNLDRRLSREELIDAVENGDWSEKKKERFQSGLENYEQLSRSWDETKVREADGLFYPGAAFENAAEEKMMAESISFLDLSEFQSHQEATASSVESGLQWSASRLKQAYAAQSIGAEPRISQGGTGDCFLLAPLRELERRDPEAISRMIQNNHDNTVTVKLPGVEKPIITHTPTDAELASYSNNVLASTIENAYALHHSELHPECNQSLIPAERLNGGAPEEPIAAFTGSKVDTLNIEETDVEHLVAELKKGTECGAIMVAASNYSLSSGSGIQRTHAYGLAYNPQTGNLILNNPYPEGATELLEPRNHDGSAKDGKSDGQFEITPAQAMDYLYSVTIESRTAK